MICKVSLLIEAFPTDTTAKWFLSCVNTHVPRQISLVFDGHATNRASAGFLHGTELDMGFRFTGGVVLFIG
jgi:hypothetical protein